MCMININVNDKRKKSLLNDDEIDFIKRATVENPDGFGYYAWNKKQNKAEIGKFYPKTPWEKIEGHLRRFNEHRSDYLFVITHARYGTSGGKGLSQVHPIPVIYPDKNGKNRYAGWYIIHNGVLDNAGELISDTQLYGYEMGQWMYNHNIRHIEEIIDCKEYVQFFEDSMFKGSRVVLVHFDKYFVFNRNTGKEVNKYGDWHSGEIVRYVTGYPTNTKWYGYDYWQGSGSYDSGYDLDFIYGEDYDICAATETIASVINQGTPGEYAEIYNLKDGTISHRKPRHLKGKSNELDYDPKKKFNK